jgi:uncharacterized Zn-finger protein
MNKDVVMEEQGIVDEEVAINEALVINEEPVMNEEANRPRNHKCTIGDCNKTLTRAENLKTHIRAVHELQSANYECPVEGCSRTFRRQNVLDRHTPGTHEHDFDCGLCDHSLSTLYALQNHVKCLHDNKYPIFCEVCQLAFDRESSLVAHKMTFKHKENVANPILCEACQLAFDKESSLVAHKMTFKHKENVAKSFDTAQGINNSSAL